MLGFLLAATIFLDGATGSPADMAQAALDAMDGEHGAPLYSVSIDGIFYLDQRLQGRTLDTEPTPITQRIAIDRTNGAIAYEVAWNNYSNSRQHFRQIHFGDGPDLWIGLADQRASWDSGSPVTEYLQRYARYDPAWLMLEVLNHPERAQRIAAGRLGGVPTRVLRYTTADGERLDLHFSGARLVGAQSPITLPVLGDTTMTWIWSDFGSAEIQAYPGRIRTYIGDAVLMDARMEYRAGDEHGLFAPDTPIAWPPPPDPAPESAGAPESSQVELGAVPHNEIADRLHFLPNLRPGFHGFLIETGNGFIAVDAPAGWYEMHQIPPMNWMPGNPVSDLGERMLAAAAQIDPDKPVTHLILTHHHSDHMGGVRPFIASGAQIIAAGNAASYVRSAARNSFAAMPDRLSTNPIDPRIEIISGDTLLDIDGVSIQLVELPPDNPKAEGYLAVFLPDTGAMITTGFIYPIPESVFPLSESVPLSRWFVDWLDNSGLTPSLIFNVHGTGRIEPWQLDYFRTEDG